MSDETQTNAEQPAGQGLGAASCSIDSAKKRLPKGNIRVSWVNSRAVFQLYVGGRYMCGCNGADEAEILRAAEFLFVMSDNQKKQITDCEYHYFIK